jgi:MYXO-CTERM domain-containing protein
MGIQGHRMIDRGVWCLAAALALWGWVSEAHATILLFDQARDATSHTIVEPTTSGASVEQDYGDRVTGSPQSVLGGQFTYGNGGEGFTPNVLVDYFVDSPPLGIGVSLWNDEYGDLTNVVFGNQTSNNLNIQLTADAGFDVLLYHFDLAGWFNTDYTINSVRVLGGGATLFSQSNVLVEGNFTGPRHTSFDFATPLSGPQLLIEIDRGNLPSGMRDNIGIDNVRFGQDPPVASVESPEPSTGLLLALGLIALPLLVRRRTGPDLCQMQG